MLLLQYRDQLIGGNVLLFKLQVTLSLVITYSIYVDQPYIKTPSYLELKISMLMTIWCTEVFYNETVPS